MRAGREVEMLATCLPSYLGVIGWARPPGCISTYCCQSAVHALQREWRPRLPEREGSRRGAKWRGTSFLQVSSKPCGGKLHGVQVQDRNVGSARAKCLSAAYRRWRFAVRER